MLITSVRREMFEISHYQLVLSEHDSTASLILFECGLNLKSKPEFTNSSKYASKKGEGIRIDQ